MTGDHSNNKSMSTTAVSQSSNNSLLENKPTTTTKPAKEETEIYIRADGKKVRRIRKTVVRTVSASSTVDGRGAGGGGDKSALGNFMSKSGIKKKRASGSATVAGSTPATAGVAGAAAKSKSFAQGEVYINKDGKKVRRVKRTVSSSAQSAAGDLMSSSSSSSRAQPPTAPKRSLSGLLDSVRAGVRKKNSGAASVAGHEKASSAALPSTTRSLSNSNSNKNNNHASSSSSSHGVGEIYVRPDGTKVRRVRRTRSSADHNMSKSLAGLGGGSSVTTNKKSGAVSVDGGITTKGEIYINKDGKKVRRVKKVKNKDLGGLLANGAAAANKKAVGGSATVAGDTPSKQQKHSKSYAEGEIYIRADGKKVRRVKKSSAASVAGTTSSNKKAGMMTRSNSFDGGALGKTTAAAAATPSLDSVVDNKAAASSTTTTPAANSGAATVSGPSPPARSNKPQEGEIYINKDGKKVRRVLKKKKSSADSIDGFLGGKQRPKKASGSATVAGDTPTKSKTYAEGEIYIRADGKKVRRVRKNAGGSSASVTAASSSNHLNSKAGDLAGADGTKKKSLTGFLNKGGSAAGGKKMGGSATVAGDRVAPKRATSSLAVGDGEIVVRPDGKKVIRRKKTAGGSAIGGGGGKSQETEVYRRADGKLVRRVKRTVSAMPATQQTKKTTTAAGDLAGFLDTTTTDAKKTGSALKTTGSATVVNDTTKPAPTISELLQDKSQQDANNSNNSRPPDDAAAAPVPVTPTSSQGPAQPSPSAETKPAEEASGAPSSSSSVPLSDAQEEIAAEYRKMSKLGLSPDAVRHKMQQDGVEARIIQAVLGEAATTQEEPNKPSSTSSPPVAATGASGSAVATPLADAEEEIASTYRKMLKMGLPSDAVRHKMEQDGVESKIVAAVLGGDAASTEERPSAAQDAPQQAAETTATSATSIQLTDSEEEIAGVYRKMAKMGLPPDAVRHKMEQDGVEEKLIAAVLGSELSGSSSSAPQSAIPLAESSSLAKDESTQPSTTVMLTEVEEETAGVYRKMAKMGLPPDAVRHKMEQDGVEEKIITAVLGELQTEPTSSSQSVANASSPQRPLESGAVAIELTESEEEIASTYRKMYKMGLPPDAVRHKMNQDGVEEKIISAVLGEPSIEPSSDAKGPEQSSGTVESQTVSISLTETEESIAGTYRKMSKMGLPPDAVRHKMHQDGVGEKIIAAVLGDPWNEPQPTATEPLSQPPAAAEPTVAAISLTDSEEAIAATYRKMAKMGLPADAVRHKMQQDGVDAKIVAAVLGDPWKETVPAGAAPDAAAKSIQLTDSEEAIAATYRKMSKMGLPPDAVRHKMQQDGVEAKIVAAVLGDPWDEPSPAAPPAPATEETARPIQLSESEESIAGTYRKMSKMGLPPDAVRHKMHQDGVEEKIIAAVLGDPWNEPQPTSTQPLSSATAATISLTDSEESVAATYRKMSKMGLPPDAVRHKMQQDGIDAKIVAAVLGDPWKEASPAPAATKPIQLTDSEEVIAATYRKMSKMGLPPDAVRHKMQQDSIDAKIVAAVLGDPWEEPLPAPVAAATDAAAKSIQLTDSEETIAATYRKMSKMGLPPDAVRHKMNQDGVEAKIVASVLGDPWKEASPVPAAAAADTVAKPVQLTESEEAIAGAYRKMSKMGLPPDAVRHKMNQDGVEAKIVAAVLGDPWNDVSQPRPGVGESPTAAISLTDSEESIAATYRKMSKMGLPPDAVRHKMQQDGIDAKIVAAVLGEPWTDPAGGSTANATEPERRASYNLMVADEKSNKGAKAPPALGAALSALPQLKRQDSFETVSPTEKFAVNLESTPASSGLKKEEETRYMTLDDIARLSGQSRDDLEKMIVARRQNAEQVPRFVLQSLGSEDDAMSLYPVQISKSHGKPAKQQPNPVDANPALANADPTKLKEVKDGEEVVDTALANAARAVSALGDGDMSALLAKLQGGDMGDLVKKLQEAEKRQKKLEKQLAQAGVAIAEDIDYGEAKAKVNEIAKRMNEIGGSDIVVPDKEEQNRLREEYFKLEQQMERYNTALMISEEYQAEQDAIERKWEEVNEGPNMEALKKIRRHMPVKIRHMSEAELTNTPSPNGKFLPKAIAKKFKRTNVLQCLRLNPDDIERMHPSTLEGFRVTGLTLTERRALYAHLKVLGPRWEKNKAEKMTERKWTWFKMMKSNFKENLAPYERHVEQYGPPGNHPYATRDNPNVGCPLIGKQCPLKADKVIDYDNDYGWTDADEYEVSQVQKADTDDPGAKAMLEALELAREKKANERADLLKKHYKGKLLQVSKANGSCEAMDEAMDKLEFATMRWVEFIIEKGGEDEADADKNKEVANFTDALNELKLSVLDFCQRSGMQTSGRKKAGGGSPDIRSSVECGLAEELYECTQEFFKFIRNRMKELGVRDTRVEKTIELLEKMMNELHGRNVATLEALGVKRPERSRKFRKNEDMRKEVEEKLKPKEEEKPAEEEEPAGPAGPPGGGGGRGGLLAAIEGGRGRGRGGGRGDLLASISGRGRGRGRGGRGGGRGDLLAAISGRGRGGGRGGGDGGRGGLLAAIQGRGGGGGRGGGDAGGRGGLLAAIQARGGGG